MTRPNLQPVAKLVPAQADKHWSFQVANRLPEHERLVKAAMQGGVVQAAQPFLQGLDHNWLMVEFWTDDVNAAKAAAASLSGSLGLTLGEGNFNRQELGLA